MRILILRLSSLGDIVLTQSVVAELRNRYPEAEIDFLCKAHYRALPELFGCAVRVIEYSPSLMWHLALLKQRYEMVIDLHGKLSTWLARALVRSSQKVVYAKQRGLRKRIVQDAKAPAISSTVELYYSALRKLGVMGKLTKVIPPRVYPSQSLPAQIALPVKIEGRKLLGLFIGATHATKVYPLEQWKELISLVIDDYDVCLMGDSGDALRSVELVRAFPVVTDLCGRYKLGELVYAIGQCDIIISGDSGPMHIAAALGKPQIAIFGGTHPRLGFAPLNEKAVVLCAELDCQPCSLHGRKSCPLGHFNCMKMLKAELLADTLKGIGG